MVLPAPRPGGRTLFDRAAVAVGGFDLGALDHLAPPGTANAAALLAELVETSMVLADHSVEPPRYRLLEPLRQVGLAHLAPADLAAARASHARWIACTSTPSAGPRTSVPPRPLVAAPRAGEPAGRARRTDRRPPWADAAALAVPLAVAHCDDVHLELIGQLCRLADAAPGTPEIRARCALAAGGACWMDGDTHEADRLSTPPSTSFPPGTRSAGSDTCSGA